MKIQLIEGQFDPKDGLDIITKMVHVKIKFQEDKIKHASNEEDIKMRETRIKRLQADLYEMRKFVEQTGNKIQIQSEINLF